VYDVRLEIQGVGYGGFRSGEFKLGLEQMCNSFDLRYSDVWVERGSHSPIHEGDRCKLTVDGNAMIDGWVDEATTAYTPVHYELSASGRSTACDLVDCAALNTPGQWTGQRIGAIATDLVRPFAAVSVVVSGDQGPKIPKFTLQRGETVGAALCRLARLRTMLVYTAGTQLVLAKVGTNRTTTVLRRGVNILEGSRKGSLADRFSEYVFKGQTRARDEVNGVVANQMRGAVQDRAVTRHRPMLVVAGGADGPADLGARAIMERNQRAGRAERVTVKVLGWKTDEGYLWEPNLRVRVTDDWLDVDQDMIVVSASFSFQGDTGSGGYQTSLELCDPRAFDTGDAPLLPRRRARPVEVWTDAPSIQGVSPILPASPLQLGAFYNRADVVRAAPQPSASTARHPNRRNP
jgi:prophage tail gpP-like protein